MTVLAVAVFGLTGLATSAYFTDSADITGNSFTSGTVDLTTTPPATSAITMAGMIPGDKVTAAITVTNAGTLPLRYAASSVTTEDVLASELDLTIKTSVSSCNDTGFGSSGTAVYSAGDLGSVAGLKIIGDSAQGNQAGDRTLAPGSEVLCVQVELPITTYMTSQSKTTTATFTFNAEHDSAASVLSGGLSTATVDASWTAVPGATSYTLTRVATTPGTAAQFSDPHGVAVTSGGTVYVADSGNSRIRKVTAAGVVSTLAGGNASGSSDGTGLGARFDNPMGLAVAADGTVYVADWNNHRIRRVTAAGVVTTLAGSTAGFADGPGATFDHPSGVAVAADGTVYVADSGNNRIRKITSDGVVTTLAGSGLGTFADGTATAAAFYSPSGVAVAADGTVYVADSGNNRIRKITSDGMVTTLAGSGLNTCTDGTGTAAAFYSPRGIAVAADGTLYVGDQFTHRIRKVTPLGVVTTLAGSGVNTFADGTGSAAAFYWPNGVFVAADGIVYVADSGNDRIRKIAVDTVVSTLAGSTRGYKNSATVAAVFSGTALSFTDTGLLAGTSYTYTVTAVGPQTVSNPIGPFAP